MGRLCGREAASCRRRSSRRATSTTRSPRAPNALAVASPIPLLAPVTITTRSVTLILFCHREARRAVAISLRGDCFGASRLAMTADPFFALGDSSNRLAQDFDHAVDLRLTDYQRGR